MKNLLFLLALLVFLTGCKNDNKKIIIVDNSTTNEGDIVLDMDNEVEEDIGDPAYNPGFKYGISDGVVIINNQGAPITDIFIDGVRYDDLFVKNKEWFSIQLETNVGAEIYIEIYFQNGKYYSDHVMFWYEGPHIYYVNKL